MRKIYALSSIVAAAMAAASVVCPDPAQALTVYEKDGLKFSIKGDWQIQLRQDYGKDQDADIEYDDLELKNAVKYDLANGFFAFGQLDFGFKNAADKSDSDEAPHLEEAHIGFGYEIGDDGEFKGWFGKGDSAADAFGIEQAIESPLGDDAFDNHGATDGDDMIKLGVDFGMVNVLTSYELKADSEKSKGNGEFFDIVAITNYAGFELGLAYQDYQDYGDPDSITLWGISAAYDAKFAKFYVDYSETEDVSAFINAAVTVPIGKQVKIGGGYQYEDFDLDGVDGVGAWYTNVTYKFEAAKNVSVFAEIGDTDKSGTDLGWLIGGRIKF